MPCVEGFCVIETSLKGAAQMSWGKAAVRAILMMLVCVLLFAVVPGYLLSYLTIRTSATVRDLLVGAWWAMGLLFALWLFVRLQRTREPAA